DVFGGWLWSHRHPTPLPLSFHKFWQTVLTESGQASPGFDPGMHSTCTPHASMRYCSASDCSRPVASWRGAPTPGSSRREPGEMSPKGLRCHHGKSYAVLG